MSNKSGFRISLNEIFIRKSGSKCHSSHVLIRIILLQIYRTDISTLIETEHGNDFTLIAFKYLDNIAQINPNFFVLKFSPFLKDIISQVSREYNCKCKRTPNIIQAKTI